MLCAHLDIAIRSCYNLHILSFKLAFENHGIVTWCQYEQQILLLILHKLQYTVSK